MIQEECINDFLTCLRLDPCPLCSFPHFRKMFCFILLCNAMRLHLVNPQPCQSISNRQPASLERLDVFGCNVAKVAKIRSGFENVQHVCLMHYFHPSCVDQSATLGHLWQQVLQEKPQENMANHQKYALHTIAYWAAVKWSSCIIRHYRWQVLGHIDEYTSDLQKLDNHMLLQHAAASICLKKWK